MVTVVPSAFGWNAIVWRPWIFSSSTSTLWPTRASKLTTRSSTRPRPPGFASQTTTAPGSRGQPSSTLNTCPRPSTKVGQRLVSYHSSSASLVATPGSCSSVLTRPIGGARYLGGDGLGLGHAARQQRLARDDQALDLGRALVQLHDLGVAHQLLDGVLLDEAVAAVDLHGVGRDSHRGVGGEALRVRGDERVALAVVELRRGLPRQQARGLDVGRHVG